MILSIASGKGGTGKTTLAVNLALSLKSILFIDCDVEEPDAHLFLKPNFYERIDASIPVPEVDDTRCTYCGKCGEICAYKAIAVLPGSSESEGNILIFNELCHGCGACSLLCPHGAIKEKDKKIGVIERGSAGGIQYIHGKLDVGEAMSPPLIRQVKASVRSFQKKETVNPGQKVSLQTDPSKNVIIDAPPGTSCPLIASIAGSDFCILVTEPTPFGLHDLKLAVETVKKLMIPFGVVINRSDKEDAIIQKYCKEQRIPVLMRIPFSMKIAALYSEGQPFVEQIPEYREKLHTLYNTIVKIKNETNYNN